MRSLSHDLGTARRLAMSAVAFVLSLSAPCLAAGGCYVCGGGSSAVCRDYCAYSGPDTFDNRHRCEAKGCRITGTSACPSTGAVKICQVPAGWTGTTVAVLDRGATGAAKAARP